MDRTPNLDMPYLLPSQAQKHVTHNEALASLDALVQLAVLDRDLTEPPETPEEGDRHIVASGASGDWSGWDGDIASRIDGAWQRLTPQAGWLAHVADEQAIVVHDGSGWTGLGTFLDALQNLSLLGLGTSADATNPLSAKLNNALFTARYASEGGDGDLRIKANKEAEADTVSYLFQTGYSGRAEFGLIGDDHFTLKVSADGATWTEALVADPATGEVDLPHTPFARTDAANTFSAVSQTFTTPSASMLFNIQSPASAGGGTELRVIQNFNGGVGPIWNSFKGRNDGAGNLTNGQVGDEGGKFESRVMATVNYKTSTKFRNYVGSTNITGGGDTPSSGWQWFARGASDTGNFDCNLELMKITHLGEIFLPQVGTTGSAANLYMNPGSSPAGQLLRSTSSERYKQDIEPLESARADAVLSLQPIWYRSKAEADKLPDGTRMSFYGLTAEAVGELDPRLVTWTWHPDDMERVKTGENPVFDEIDTGRKDSAGKPVMETRQVDVENVFELRPKEGARRVPDGVAYERLTVMLLDIVRRQEARIAALEAAGQLA